MTTGRTRLLWILGVIAAVAGLVGIVLAVRNGGQTYESAALYRGAPHVSSGARGAVWTLGGTADTVRCRPRCTAVGSVRVQAAIRYRGRRPLLSARVTWAGGGGVKPRIRVSCVRGGGATCGAPFFRSALGFATEPVANLVVRSAPLAAPAGGGYRWTVEVAGETTSPLAQFVDVTWATRRTPAVACDAAACRFSGAG